MTRAVKRWWEATAEYFQVEANLPVAVDYGPGAPTDAEFGLLGDVAGADVVELGCGGAQCGVALAERGAAVVGVDLSAAQLAHARELVASRGADVHLLQADVTDLGMLPTDSFDLAVSSWAFQWVEDLDACFREARRLLRAGGRFVFSLPHPVYGLVDPERGTVERSYFATGPRVRHDADVGLDMVTYPHTVGDVHGSLRAAGLDVERLLEPGSSDPADYETDVWEFRPELMSKLPATLVVAARA